MRNSTTGLIVRIVALMCIIFVLGISVGMEIQESITHIDSPYKHGDLQLVEHEDGTYGVQFYNVLPGWTETCLQKFTLQEAQKLMYRDEHYSEIPKKKLKILQTGHIHP